MYYGHVKVANYFTAKTGHRVPGGRGGGVLPYISRISICRPKGYGIDFVHFSLESGMNFENTTGVYERVYRFNSRLNKK